MNIQQTQELEKTLDNLLTNRGWKQQPQSTPHSYIYNNPNYSIYDEVRICWMDDYVKISVPVKNFPFLYVSKFEYSVATDSEIVSFIENHVSAYERVRH